MQLFIPPGFNIIGVSEGGNKYIGLMGNIMWVVYLISKNVVQLNRVYTEKPWSEQ